MRLAWAIAVFVSMASSLVAQENRIDLVRPDAPELAAFGDYDIGVRTLEFVDHDRIDILNTQLGGENAFYDRSLTIEVWYPAELGPNQEPGGQYQAITRNPAITATLSGTAVRDAEPDRADGRYPLVIISHGHPGNRYLISHLGENLASKGYVVASIDHTDSTYHGQQDFQSTLINRPLDQRFVLDTLDKLSNDVSSFLNGLLDATTTGIVGYSMGGYGLLNNLGGGYNDDMVGSRISPPNELLYQHATGNPDYRANLDPRIKAGFAIAPWGMTAGFWRSEDLAGIDVPTFYVAGDNDTTAGYEYGVRAIFEATVNSDRYLLTFKNAGHNAGGPYPVPVEILNNEDTTGASHYTDPVWDNTRMNNIMDHFATAYFDLYLKHIEGRQSYLDVVPDGADAVYSVTRGQQNSDHTYWKGFGRNTAIGLKLERLRPGE